MYNRQRGKRIFVAYSREDEELVGPVSQLMQMGDAQVFWDKMIPPGTKWRETIASEIEQSDSLVVLWCCHALESEWVAHEVSLATRNPGRQVAPVLLCDHPVQRDLAEYQWIDLRELVSHPCRFSPITRQPVIDPDSLHRISGRDVLATKVGFSNRRVDDLAAGPQSELLRVVLLTVAGMLARGEFSRRLAVMRAASSGGESSGGMVAGR